MDRCRNLVSLLTDVAWINTGTDMAVRNAGGDTSSSQVARGMVLPFQPLSLAFNHVNYYVDMPAEMKSQGVDDNRLQLLRDVSGAFRPGILTALVGVSGAGKTTLMDVLAGRKTGGYIEGSISISGFPKNQETFARVSGYCEQNDIHSPYVTVYESLLYSAWLRLASDVNTERRKLLLMKRGGQVIYTGPLGRQSHKLVEYFEGLPRLQTVTIQLHGCLRRNQDLIKELSTPAPGAKDLYFPNQYSQPFLTQCKACFWKQHWSYWRNSQYNAIRFFMTAVFGILFGVIFWKKGNKISEQQDLLNLLGAVYAAILFLGGTNASSVQTVVAVERTVFYRERAAGMYSELPYAFAQVAIETIYVCIQTIIYALLLFSMIGFEWKLSKVLYFYYFIFMCFTYFSMYGMMVVALTPNHQIAAICMSFFLSFWNLFSGFLVPRPLIPVWWRWYYWCSPVAWTIYGIFTSQVGDKDTPLLLEGGTNTTVKKFLKDNMGFDEDFLIPVLFAHLGWVLGFFLVFAYGIKFLNFQRR
ncbi:hypothetical protein RHGRI_036688 [Rhododendron griersonianum]|uniref:Uncharacterized protein n=1 Tax=Rhododendron griersonianum TaxID=479676 RepID=A0AAV6HNZ2_9ERIC|nr:hypothetical protein RHGRI_036688 [Rhododendron griersonianum]